MKFYQSITQTECLHVHSKTRSCFTSMELKFIHTALCVFILQNGKKRANFNAGQVNYYFIETLLAITIFCNQEESPRIRFLIQPHQHRFNSFSIGLNIDNQHL